jgi:hypothetical protein
MPLDARAREIAVKAAYALEMMRRGAALSRCDWNVDFEQGIKVPFNHGDGAEVLSALACLRARLRFEAGEKGDGLEDLIAAVALGRYVSQDGTLDSITAGYHIERRASETLARYLPRLDRGLLQELKTRLAGLPRSGSAAAATLRMEEALLDWIAGETRAARDKESLLAFLTQLCGSKSDALETNRARGRACLEQCGGTGEGVLKFVNDMRPRCAALANTLDLAPAEIEKGFERETRKLAANPLFKLFAPVLHNIRVRQARTQTRRALLAAALAIQLDGQDALQNHPDPVAGGPFAYVGLEGGYLLRSKQGPDKKIVLELKLDEQLAKPVELRVGGP